MRYLRLKSGCLALLLLVLGGVAWAHSVRVIYLAQSAIPPTPGLPPCGTFARTGVITLNTGENTPVASFIDTNYFYVVPEVSPPIIVRVRLSDFTRVDSLTLTSSNSPGAAAIDRANGFAYVAINSSPGRIEKINLASFTSVATLTTSGTNEGLYRSMAIDTTNGFLYVASGTVPARIVKINLTTFTQSGGTLVLNAGENASRGIALDISNNIGYFGMSTAPIIVVKVNLVGLTRVGALTLDAGDDVSTTEGAAIDATNGFVYFSALNPAPGRVIKIDIPSFTKVASVNLSTGANSARTITYDALNGFLYVGTSVSPTKVDQINLASFTDTGNITLASGENLAQTSQRDTLGSGYTYYATYTTPSRVVKVCT